MIKNSKGMIQIFLEKWRVSPLKSEFPFLGRKDSLLFESGQEVDIPLGSTIPRD